MSLKFEELVPVLEDLGPKIQLTANTVAASMADPTKAPGRFPYPLDTIMDSFADAYLSLQTISTLLHEGSHNKALTSIQRQRLRQLRDRMRLSAKAVRRTATEIDREFAT